MAASIAGVNWRAPRFIRECAGVCRGTYVPGPLSEYLEGTTRIVFWESFTDAIEALVCQ